MPQNGQVVQQDNHASTTSRLAAIGQISAGIAHEVRNPLTSVKGFLQLIQREVSNKYVDIALSELERAIDTLQNLLHVSKPDLDDEPYSWVSIYAEIQSILYLFQDKLYDTEVIQKCENVDIKIYGKRNQLKKAFFNLIKNAFEAITDKGKIQIQHYKQKDSLFLVITDNGSGIPEDKLDLLGTPFYTTKSEGTGMGLAQVYTTVYQHGATISVRSKVGSGTSFIIEFPILKKDVFEVNDLNLTCTDGKFIELLEQNMKLFYDLLEKEASHVFDRVHELQSQSIDIMHTINRLIEVLDDENRANDLIMLGKEHGVIWAKNNLPLLMKIDFIHAFRIVYWDFLHEYYKNHSLEQTDFFCLERRINRTLDLFLEHFTATYQNYQSEVLDSQREIIDELTSPIIPLSTAMAVLPLIGSIDTRRAKTIQERVLIQISSLNIRRIIIDLSGVAFMDTAVVGHLFKIIDGISLLGCKTVITGLRPEIVNTMIELGIQIPDRIETFGSLDRALEKYHLE